MKRILQTGIEGRANAASGSRERPAVLGCLLATLLLAPLAALHGADATLATHAAREIVVEKKLLHFPVKNGAAKRVVSVSMDGVELRRFEVELAAAAADWWAPLDMSAWAGKKVSVMAEGLPAEANALAALRQSDVLLDAENLYREPLRPQFHFSPRRGWVGDPNGLVYYKGDYHLFFQYNPYGTKWGNMHWGHAISRDLVHWQERPITFYPPKLGDHPYSGSAVVDRENTAGFKNGPEDPIVIVFPSTKRGTCLAYSADAGRTFTEYAGNPLARNLGGDPRVLWHEPTHRWVMITGKILKADPAAPPGTPNWKAKAKCGFEFFTSPDLKHWTRESCIEDYWECPELFELPVDGDRQHAKWVVYANQTPSLISRGEEHFGRYAIGSFDGKRFTAEQEKIRFNYGDAYAAAQTYNGIPAADGRRINIGCAFHTRMPGMPFQQMMNFPTELTLRTTEDGPRLFAWPIREIASLYAATREFSKLPLSPEGSVLPGVEAGLLDISVEFSVGVATEEVGLTLRGVDVTFDAKSGLLKCADRAAPLKPVNGTIKLRLLLDRVSLEIFANEGRVYMPMAILPKEEERAVAVFAKGDDARLTSLTATTLKSAWENGTGTKP